jgi:hypothetical protein
MSRPGNLSAHSKHKQFKNKLTRVFWHLSFAFPFYAVESSIARLDWTHGFGHIVGSLPESQRKEKKRQGKRKRGKKSTAVEPNQPSRMMDWVVRLCIEYNLTPDDLVFLIDASHQESDLFIHLMERLKLYCKTVVS